MTFLNSILRVTVLSAPTKTRLVGIIKKKERKNLEFGARVLIGSRQEKLYSIFVGCVLLAGTENSMISSAIGPNLRVRASNL